MPLLRRRDEPAGTRCQMREKLFAIGDDFWIEAGELSAKGNIVDHEYEIERDGHKIAEISKRWFRVRDTYGIEIVTGRERRADPSPRRSASTRWPDASRLAATLIEVSREPTRLRARRQTGSCRDFAFAAVYPVSSAHPSRLSADCPRQRGVWFVWAEERRRSAVRRERWQGNR